MNIMGEETPDEVKQRMLIEALHKLAAELAENAKQPRRELDGWDHKREYRRLHNVAAEILNLAIKKPSKVMTHLTQARDDE